MPSKNESVSRVYKMAAMGTSEGVPEEKTASEQGFELEEVIGECLSALAVIVSGMDIALSHMREKEIRKEFGDHANGVDHFIEASKGDLSMRFYVQDKWQVKGATQRDVAQFLTRVDQMRGKCAGGGASHLWWVCRVMPSRTNAMPTLKDKNTRVFACDGHLTIPARAMLDALCCELGVMRFPAKLDEILASHREDIKSPFAAIVPDEPLQMLPTMADSAPPPPAIPLAATKDVHDEKLDVSGLWRDVSKSLLCVENCAVAREIARWYHLVSVDQTRGRHIDIEKFVKVLKKALKPSKSGDMTVTQWLDIQRMLAGLDDGRAVRELYVRQRKGRDVDLPVCLCHKGIAAMSRPEFIKLLVLCRDYGAAKHWADQQANVLFV